MPSATSLGPAGGTMRTLSIRHPSRPMNSSATIRKRTRIGPGSIDERSTTSVPATGAAAPARGVGREHAHLVDQLVRVTPHRPQLHPGPIVVLRFDHDP